MILGILDSGLDPSFLIPGKTHLLSFSTWHLEVRAHGYEVQGKIFEPEEIAHWWLGDGRQPPCWDSSGHGSRLAQVIFSQLPGIKFHCAQVLGRDNSGDESVILAAWDWLLDQGVDVINLSLGGQVLDQSPWEDRGKKSLAAGVKIFASAGLLPGVPACISGVEAVGDTLLKSLSGLQPSWHDRINHWIPSLELNSLGAQSSSSLACGLTTARWMKKSLVKTRFGR